MSASLGITLPTEDERLIAVLENLIHDYLFTIPELSRLLHIDSDIIESIIDAKEVDIENRYLLSTRAMYLFYVLKRTR